MLTVEERQFLSDHLRAGGRTCAKYAAIEHALLGAGTALGWVIGTAIGTTSRLLARTRPSPRIGG